MITVSVLIPTYNEEATVLEILRKGKAVKFKGVTFEVLVIDDGSKDQTIELLETSPDLYEKLVKTPQKSGKGAAVKAGLTIATSDYVIFHDVDLEYDPVDFANLLYLVVKHKAEVVMGSPFIALQYMQVSSFWHNVGNYVITFIFNILKNNIYKRVWLLLDFLPRFGQCREPADLWFRATC